MSESKHEASGLRRLLHSVGPAIIVASIVLGPGSILISSRIGCEFGTKMIWVLVASVILMIGMTALAAYLGAIHRRTLCQEVAHRFGSVAGIVISVLMFLIIVGFQISNNAAILAIMEGLIPSDSSQSPAGASSLSVPLKVATLIGINGLLVAMMFGWKNLYRPLEKMMMILVLAMLIGFGINLVFAQPSWINVASGLVPSIPETSEGQTNSVFVLLGLVATTFSIAGAFYQSYLVKEKGWDIESVRKGLWDSVVGISLLGMVSAMIMVTSATALHGKVAGEELKSVVDVARQLEPLFGSTAFALFGVGLFAAAFSSFLGNALIGGTILSDGLGLGASVEQFWPKTFTVFALMIGMGFGIYTTIAGHNAINSIYLAQALTVLGTPLLAMIMVGFGIVAKRDRKPMPWWILVISSLGLVVSFVLAGRVALNLWG